MNYLKIQMSLPLAKEAVGASTGKEETTQNFWKFVKIKHKVKATFLFLFSSNRKINSK